MHESFQLILSIIPFLIWLYLIFLYANKNLQFNGLFWTGNIILENQKTKNPLPEKKKSLCIMVPARNEEKYISETIKSILTQDVKKFVLIVDDNSQMMVVSRGGTMLDIKGESVNGNKITIPNIELENGIINIL